MTANDSNWRENHCRRRLVNGNVTTESCLIDISDSEDEFNHNSHNRHESLRAVLSLLGYKMRWLWTRLLRWRMNIMLSVVFTLAIYLLYFDMYTDGFIPDGAIDLEELEEELEVGHPVRVVTYKSPIDDKIYGIPLSNKTSYDRDRHFERQVSRALKFNQIWTWADNAIGEHGLFHEAPEVDEVLDAMRKAKFVSVEVLNIGKYLSGTSEKWIVTLEGGQKALLKLVWEPKGTMKADALCNYGFEMPTSEIAAFHLHRILGFLNTPYVTGRVLDLDRDVVPVASPTVRRQLITKGGNKTCVIGKCYFCKEKDTLCPKAGKYEASLAYWVPRKLELQTFPPKYMPYSTTRMDEWGDIGFNNKSYCDKIRQLEPYNQDRYYYDLFDFATLDTLMYHFDSKHYLVSESSAAEGLTIRLDHGRAFCANDRDDKHIFMAPLTQCCTLRKSTWEKLTAQTGGHMTRKLYQRLSRDPLAPVLEDKWYAVLERRLEILIDVMTKCAQANGGWQNVLVED